MDISYQEMAELRKTALTIINMELKDGELFFDWYSENRQRLGRNLARQIPPTGKLDTWATLYFRCELMEKSIQKALVMEKQGCGITLKNVKDSFTL